MINIGVIGTASIAKRYVIDAIVYFCEQEHLDPESVKNLITPPLKEKIESDAMSYNMLKPNAKKGKGKLPI